MKRIFFLLLTSLMLCLLSISAKGQSTMEFQSGTTIEVTNDADICAANISISGTYFGNGTKCGGTLFIPANAKIFFQGPYSSGSMTTTLNSSGLIPLTQPYNTTPWSYAGTETVASIPAGVVDYVLVELRTGTAAGTKVASRAGFVKSNGAIVDVDGTDQLRFNVSEGSYYMIVRHRNHLAIMSAAAVALSAASALYDFTTAQTQAYGTNPMIALSGGGFGMIAGDGNADGIVDATDRSSAWNDRLQTGLKSCDVNLDGIVDATDRSDIWNKRLLQTQVP